MSRPWLEGGYQPILGVVVKDDVNWVFCKIVDWAGGELYKGTTVHDLAGAKFHLLMLSAYLNLFPQYQ